MLRRHTLAWPLFTLTAIVASFLIGCGQGNVSTPDSTNTGTSTVSDSDSPTCTLSVSGMTWVAYAASVQSGQEKLAGVESAKVDLKAGEVPVRFDDDKVKLEEIA